MNFTEKEVKQLRKLYNMAVKEDKNTFEFAGSTLLVGYAKYLLEYLDSIFK